MRSDRHTEAPAGWRPVCVLTRDAAIAVLNVLTYAPITRTIRGIHSEVEVGPAEGLPEARVITCDNLITIPMASLDDKPVGHDVDLVHRYRFPDSRGAGSAFCFGLEV